MAKKIKAAILLCLTACLAVFAFALAACGNGDTNEAFDGTISVTVTYEDGSPVEGVGVQLCIYDDYEAGILGTCLRGVLVDENGTAIISGIEENKYYQIHLENVPEGYSFDNTQYDTQLGVYSYTVQVVAA